MKKFLSILTVFLFSVSALCSCGIFQAREIVEISETAENVPTLQECHKTINNSKKPEVVKFSFSGECTGNIKKYASVKDIYDTNYLHNGVVGLVGVPFELTYGEEINAPAISFNYNKDELKGISEKNLIVLHYDEKEDFYNIIESVLDTNNCTVFAEIEEDGVYLLADSHQWYDYIGKDSKWVTDYDTGDIMELADIEWAMENAPDFHVSTVEELASVVWYANTAEMTELSLTLEDDIDLTGYEWKSMNWQYTGNRNIDFKGFIEGNNHTINGMKIHEENCYNVGFLGFAVNTTMQNISFTNADVSADYAVGIAAGKLYADEKAEIEWKNVHVSGKITAYDGYGAIAGFGDQYWFAPFTDCTADVTVNGEPFEYLTYDEKEEADRIALQDTFTITLHDDGTITRDEHEGFIDLGWTVTKNNTSCQLPLDAVENPVYNVEEAVALYYTGRHPHPEGTYEIYLTGRTDPNKHTQRVSNVIAYVIEDVIEEE